MQKSDVNIVINPNVLKYINDNFDSLYLEKIKDNKAKLNLFIKNLEKKSIIYYIVGYTNGRKVKHIMLNPFLARKRKTFKIECISVFDNFNELI